ncbi:MAG: hypothetical protein ACC645_16115 [Pirellulales bacterium]
MPRLPFALGSGLVVPSRCALLAWIDDRVGSPFDLRFRVRRGIQQDVSHPSWMEYVQPVAKVDLNPKDLLRTIFRRLHIARCELGYIFLNNPIAFIAEQAGGRATNGTRRIMEVEPTDIHQRTARSFRIVSPFQGYGSCLDSLPRALPWADMFRPFRAEKVARAPC